MRFGGTGAFWGNNRGALTSHHGIWPIKTQQQQLCVWANMSGAIDHVTSHDSGLVRDGSSEVKNAYGTHGDNKE